jgi:nucleotide-binding universal stress UspA family protein
MDAGDTIPDSATKRDGGDPVAMILIVANQTLPSAALAAEIAKRIASGATEFHVVVPATPPPGGGFTWDEDAARAEAEGRLAAFLERLRGQGATADGETGDRDPIAAVNDASRNRDIAEVILSTLPVGISRWLRQDVPSRLRGAVSVPVIVVEEQPAPSSP